MKVAMGDVLDLEKKKKEKNAPRDHAILEQRTLALRQLKTLAYRAASLNEQSQGILWEEPRQKTARALSEIVQIIEREPDLFNPALLDELK